uniref:Surface layer protein HAP50 n=1 Tax=Lactobacillus acidophilus TaxID=1579 RepID=Q9L5V6_LACAI|nr:surface layer protein HAP50 [Lactobacillus acidophilus]
MKKNRKFLGLAAAALLAVAPVVTSAVPVSADTPTVDPGLSKPVNSPAQSQVTGATPFFSYQNGNPIYSGGETPNINAGSFTTIGQIVDAINKNIVFGEAGSTGTTRQEDISAAEVIRQLKADSKSVEIKGNDAKATVSKLPANFVITLKHTVNGQANTLNVRFYTTSQPTESVDKSAPVFYVTEGSSAAKQATSGAYYQVAAGSNFNPLSFVNSNGETVSFSARQADGNNAGATVSVASNPVDTTNAGRFYTVTLTATNTSNKTSRYSYTVLIVSNGLQKVYANGASSVATYSIYGNQVSSNSTTFKDGQEVYVGNTTRTINNVSYSKVSTKSKADADQGNLWIQTSALTQTTPTTPSDSNAETHTVMVDSRAYDKDGNYLGHMYYAYDNIDIVPTVVTINGKTYYKVANKDEYVSVTNITGHQRTLRHNAYIYWSSYRRTPGTGKMYRGQTVTTYGPAMRFKNGKKYYRIQGCRNNNKRYIKAANFY